MKYGPDHLTYCLNVHPGETWQDVVNAVEGPAGDVKRVLAPDARFGLGLRVSAQALAAVEQPHVAQTFRERLDALGMYVFTINGFPYGPFHGTSVKDHVYLPDWSAAERGQYTSQLAVLLAQLLPDGCRGSISTVPLGFRAHEHTTGQTATMRQALADQVIQLAKLEEETGKWVQLALEPEPGCTLETLNDAAAFFEHDLCGAQVLNQVARGVGAAGGQAVDLVRRHVGVCIDTCHAAVEFERPEEALECLRSAGVSVSKLQLSSGLRVDPSNSAALAALRAFDEPVYLHQVVVKESSGKLVRFNDLGEVFQRPQRATDQEWRVHFHVPVHVSGFGVLDSTRSDLERWLALHAARSICDHLEVETYTWAVLPTQQTSLVQSLVSELRWVMEQLPS